MKICGLAMCASVGVAVAGTMSRDAHAQPPNDCAYAGPCMTAIDTQPGQAAIGGIETNGTGISGADTGSGQGAYGSSNLGIGVAGISNERDGGWTIPSGSFGVYGTSILGNGVYGITSASAYSGVAGINSGAGNGVYGDSSTGTGVQGITGSGSYSDGSYPFTG